MKKPTIESLLKKAERIKSSKDKTLIKFFEDGYNFKEAYPKLKEYKDAYKTGLEINFNRNGIYDLVDVDEITAKHIRFRGFYKIFRSYLRYAQNDIDDYLTYQQSYRDGLNELEGAIKKAEDDFDKNISYSKDDLDASIYRISYKIIEHTLGALLGLRLFDRYRKTRLSSIAPGKDKILDGRLINQFNEEKKKILLLIEQIRDSHVKSEKYEKAALDRDYFKKIEGIRFE